MRQMFWLGWICNAWRRRHFFVDMLLRNTIVYVRYIILKSCPLYVYLFVVFDKRGKRGLCVLRKIMKLVTNFFFLSPFTYSLLLLVVQTEKEWKTEKRLRYFQLQLLFPGLQLFRGVQCFSWTSKINIFSIEVLAGIWEKVSYRRQEAHFSRHA